MSRADVLGELLVQTRSFLFNQIHGYGLGDAESEDSFNLMIKTSHLVRDLSQVTSDEAALNLEADRIRPALVDLRRYALRNHLTLARPFWGGSSVVKDPNSFAYVGSKDLEPQLQSLSKSRKLTMTVKAGGWGSGRRRWSQLRESPVGVFDFRSDSTELPSTAYALGIALALGDPAVVLAVDTETLPFDIDQKPVDPADESALARALDLAFFRLDSTTRSSSVQETLAQLSEQARSDDALAKSCLERIRGGERIDPVNARRTALSILETLPQESYVLLTPIWPGCYPVPGRSCCFHVMPFSEEWSDDAREAARDALRILGIEYIRGDENGEDRIIRGIWEGIARSDFVLVDVTGLNTNVCLELGLAHALGRPTLIVRRNDRRGSLFPEISKLQIPKYTDESIGSIVEAFIVRNANSANLPLETSRIG